MFPVKLVQSHANHGLTVTDIWSILHLNEVGSQILVFSPVLLQMGVTALQLPQHYTNSK